MAARCLRKPVARPLRLRCGRSAWTPYSLWIGTPGGTTRAACGWEAAPLAVALQQTEAYLDLRGHSYGLAVLLPGREPPLRDGLDRLLVQT